MTDINPLPAIVKALYAAAGADMPACVYCDADSEGRKWSNSSSAYSGPASHLYHIARDAAPGSRTTQ